MIERVAASIVIAQQRGLDRNGVARAVFEAIRDPTKEMADAAVEVSPMRVKSRLTAYICWVAMTDHVLKDEA